MSKKDLFLANLRGELTGQVPVWLMRQAGRYMAEYRTVREKYSFEEICKTPRIAAEVTCSPVEVFNLDAAIIFSDILFVVEPFGFRLTYEPGPEILPALKDSGQVEMFEVYDSSEKLGFVGEGILQAKKMLGPDLPMIGFCGAPFTVFCFLCGVKGARAFHKPYRFLSDYPSEAGKILEVISEVSLQYLKMQIQAGADYIQLFDTFAGELSREEFEIWSKPYLEYIINGLKNEKTYSGIFIRNSHHLLKSAAGIDCDSFCADWKTDISEAADILKPKVLQGNLNPNLLLGPKESVIEKTEQILKDMKEYPGYIFNLGHGILPDTPPGNVRALVETVHNFNRELDG